jgi:hypothetical protein
VIHHLVSDGDTQLVARLIAREPFSWILEYDRRCVEHPEWPRLPDALVEDARRGLRDSAQGL